MPVRVPAHSREVAGRFNVDRTPTVVLLKPDGSELTRAIGFRPPKELVGLVKLALAEQAFELDRFDQAAQGLTELLAESPKAQEAPKAIFLLGVARYKKNHDVSSLKEAHQRLKAEHPHSEWTRRAAAYELL